MQTGEPLSSQPTLSRFVIRLHGDVFCKDKKGMD